MLNQRLQNHRIFRVGGTHNDNLVQLSVKCSQGDWTYFFGIISTMYSMRSLQIRTPLCFCSLCWKHLIATRKPFYGLQPLPNKECNKNHAMYVYINKELRHLAICTYVRSSLWATGAYTGVYTSCVNVCLHISTELKSYSSRSKIQNENSADQDADEQLSRLHQLLIQSPWTKQTIQFMYICKLSPSHCLVVCNLICVLYTHPLLF